MRLMPLVFCVALGVVHPSIVAEAQQAAKVYRIGVLREGPDPPSSTFEDAMRELGWLEGKNLTIERRNADRREQLPALAAELVRLRVDLILTGGTAVTQAAKDATKTIPIVFNLGDDPVASGLVASFARPGGNLTGFALGLYDEKLLELLKEALPRTSRVAYAAAAGAERGGRTARLNAAGGVLGVELQRIEVRDPKDFDHFFAVAKRRGADAAVVPNVAVFRPYLERIGASAAKSHLPAIGYDGLFAQSGGLLSYGPAPFQNVPRLAAQIDRILKGARPADIPVEQPTKFELVINLKTARVLGLTIPRPLILRADRVIE